MFMSCGDTLVDLFSQPTGTTEGSSPGDIALAGHVGGSPLNVALGLARLGNSAAYLCKNSSDFIGQRIAAYLQANNVETRWIVPTELNSTLAMIRTNDDGSANYAFYTDNTADVSMRVEEIPDKLPEELLVLNFASYSTAVESTRSALLALASREKDRRLVAYDPNLRPSIEPDMDIWRDSFTKFSACAGFLKASDEDIRTLYGDKASLEDFAADATGRGINIVVVTEGEAGATAYAAGGAYARSSPVKINVVDTVGAGDTFQASSLHYLNAKGHIVDGVLDHKSVDLQELVEFAATAAAITCSRRGADLPTLDEVESALQSK